jgi:flavin reductase (DIM6/NTAB) family NADH-FMN oxidoreductase RutF
MFTPGVLRRYGHVVSHLSLVGPFPAGANPDEYDHLRRRVLWAMPAGIYLLGARAGEQRNLMTCTWVTQVSREPKLLGVSVEREAVTHDLIERGRAFALSIVPRAERAVVRHFVKPVTTPGDGTSLNGVACGDAASTGSPVLASALGYLDCRLERSIELGSHTFFVGEVVDAYLGPDASGDGVLRMEDTRMNYGG